MNETTSSTTNTESTDKFESGKSHAKQAAQDIRSAAEAKASELRGKAEQAYGQAKDRARSWQEEGENYVRQNPLRGVLTALGIGFILGLLIRR